MFTSLSIAASLNDAALLSDASDARLVKQGEHRLAKEE